MEKLEDNIPSSGTLRLTTMSRAIVRVRVLYILPQLKIKINAQK